MRELRAFRRVGERAPCGKDIFICTKAVSEYICTAEGV